MPSLIKDGQVQRDAWQGPIYTLEELNKIERNEAGQLGVTLEPDQPPCSIEIELHRLALVAINFPVFTDGRGFSSARELRELGYSGEIRATGHFIRDQLHYLKRCGFDAFELADGVDPEQWLQSLADFTESYQASVDQKEPLFRRR